MKQWSMQTLTFLKFLMKNLCLISRDCRTWQRSAAPTKKPVTSSVGKSKNHKGPTCGVTIVTRTTTTWLIAERLLNLNSRKWACFEAKAEPRKKSLAFLFEEISALKRQLQLKFEKTASGKKSNKES
jgi:hypothetical protein